MIETLIAVRKHVVNIDNLYIRSLLYYILYTIVVFKWFLMKYILNDLNLVVIYKKNIKIIQYC